MRDLAKPHESLDFEQDDEDSLDLRHYWSVIWRRKWVILGLALMITLLAALVTASLTPVYRSTTTILIEDRQPNVVSIQQVGGGEFNRWDFIPTQIGILQSRELARKLAERMKLVGHPEFQPDPEAATAFNWRDYVPTWLGGQFGAPEAPLPTPAEVFDGVVEAVMERLTVTPVRNSMLVNISFDAHDAKLAARVPNELAEVYIESDLEAKLQMTEKATSWLTGRLEGLRENLETSERALQAYREQAGIVETGSGDTTSSRLDQLNSRLVEARQERVRAETIFRQVRELGNNLERLETIPAVQGHPAVQAVHQAQVEAEMKLTELSQRYGPKHPKMIGALSTRDAARRETQAQIRKVIDGIEKEYQIARSNEASLAREVAATRSEVQDIDRKEYRLRVLERDVASNRELYDLFLSRSKETGVSSDLQSAIARVVDFATVSSLPYKPNKRRIVMVALVLGLLLGGLLAFLLEHLDNTFKSTEEVEQRLGLAVLGMLPLVRVGGKNPIKHPERAFEEEPKGGFAEAVRTIRTGVMLSGLDNPHKVIVVTSSVPGEGKSTVAMNLALALSHMERVLLIDADMRRPTLAGHLDLPGDTPGLSAIVVGTSQGRDCVHPAGGGQLHIMPSGVVPPNPLELISSQRFAAVVAKCSEVYDRIVIDSAPTLAVSDALMLSRLASAVVYVVKADVTPYNVAQQGISRLKQVDAPLLGVVLNQLDTRKMARYYGKYGYGGYSGYGYASK